MMETVEEEFFIVASCRSDGQVPKLSKAMHDKILFCEKEAASFAETCAAEYDCEFGVYRFLAKQTEE